LIEFLNKKKRATRNNSLYSFAINVLRDNPRITNKDTFITEVNKRWSTKRRDSFPEDDMKDVIEFLHAGGYGFHINVVEAVATNPPPSKIQLENKMNTLGYNTYIQDAVHKLFRAEDERVSGVNFHDITPLREGYIRHRLRVGGRKTRKRTHKGKQSRRKQSRRKQSRRKQSRRKGKRRRRRTKKH
jgi:hypothetical protein